MATIAENLQTIKDSTDAIKQAIIDKGGTVSGDITTWASAISAIETGGGSDEEYIFNGTISYSGSQIILSGFLSNKPELDLLFLVLLYVGSPLVTTTKRMISAISETETISLTLDTGEALMGNEIPGICLVHLTSGKIFPVKFEKEIGTDPA